MSDHSYRSVVRHSQPPIKVTDEEWREYDCGCRAAKVRDGFPHLTYCSTHAAAPRLLAALQRIRDEDGTSIIPGVVTISDGVRLAYCKDIARVELEELEGEK